MKPVNYNKLSQPERRLLRKQYVKFQNGLCAHCKEPLSGSPSKDVSEKSINLRIFPPNFLKWPIHLHHDHDTGMTIGVIHARCNAVLWQYHGE